MSGREHSVALFLLEDRSALEALLTETRTFQDERLHSAAVAAFAQFAGQLDRHLRLQEHALFPRPRRQSVWAALCVTSRRLRAAVAAVEAAYDDEGAFEGALARVETLFRRSVRQESRVLDPIALRQYPESPHERGSQRRSS